MAETDILNPRRGYDPDFGDSMNPNLGWNRDRPSTLAMIKPAGGHPWSRNTGNSGHTYKLNYTRRNLTVTERLKRFFEEFEQSFFTLIDHDLGRHYVGRFEGGMPQTMDDNGRFSSTGWTFVEMPGAPMLEYPSDFDRWGITARPIDDWGDQATATTSTAANAWVQPPPVVGDDGVSRAVRQLKNAAPTANDAATHEYRGYGFRLWALQGPGYGKANLLVDGVQVATLDCYNAAEIGPQIVYLNTAMSLDIHRVQVVLTATKNAASSGTAFVWDKLEMIR